MVAEGHSPVNGGEMRVVEPNWIEVKIDWRTITARY